MKDLTGYRKSYQRTFLLDNEADVCPFVQFSKWFDEVDTPEHRKFLEPNAMLLSTVDQKVQPRSRTMLLKKFDKGGFIFFTNYESEKARNISQNDKVCLSFFWGVLERQVHIYGKAEKISVQESDRYFAERPYESQVAACVSPQSRPVKREEIYQQYEEMIKKKSVRSQQISRPYFWGGYCVVPHEFEYWQGGASRLHDRIVYHKDDGYWTKIRLAP